MFMAMQQCPECHKELPADYGVHASSPVAGAVQCPHCGSTVTLEKPRVAPAQASPEEAEATAGGAFERGRQSLKDLNPEEQEADTPSIGEGLERARARMQEAASEPGAIPGLGVQEEETARIADHLVFPGTGIDDLKKDEEPLDDTLSRLGVADVTREKEGSLEQAARLGREPGSQPPS
jgi:hypothetical protein